jgi:hypothetical protein
MSRRKLVYLLSGLVAVGRAAAAAGWYHVVTRADYQLRDGEEALERGDLQQAERSLRRLEADGHAAEAHLLRGETAFAEIRLFELNPHGGIPGAVSVLVSLSPGVGRRGLESLWQIGRSVTRAGSGAKAGIQSRGMLH